ncbi:MAG TPA: CHASE2 domain-containing protein [Smithellaceae bacterium]|nr:CHASE2 domain-containing protein [Smithellaceae bacterium]
MKERIKIFLKITPSKITSFVIILALLLFFSDFPFLRFMELKTLDLRIASRGALPTGGETVIAVIDEKSVMELGRWPWPRTTIARLVDKLKDSGAKAIGFDIVFSEPDTNSSLRAVTELSAEMKAGGVKDGHVFSLLNKKRAVADTDAALAKSIRRAQNITLGYFFHFKDHKGNVVSIAEKEIAANTKNIQSSRYLIINSSEQNPDDSRMPHAYAPVANIPIIAEAAKNSGYFNTFPDSDGSNRWSPLVIKLRDNYYSSLAVSTLIQYLDSPQVALNIESFGVESIRIGNISIPTDDRGRLLVNYMGPEKTFPHYSIADIIKGKIPAEKLRGKIVLVGATAIGIYDLRVTPFGSTYPGVEIHANVIDNILHQNFLRYSFIVKFVDIILIIFSGLLVAFAISRVKAITGALTALAVILVYLAINIFVFFKYNIWLNLTYPLLTMIAIYLGITIYRYIKEEREKKKIRGAFQYYLTASVINEMLKDPSKLKLGGDKKDLSVLFSDIRGFTTISEKLSPEELVHLLNEYLTAMTDIVFKHDGTLDKYMGDAIMAVFGAPLDQPDHARRACMTALEMMSELHRLQKKWQEEGRPLLNIGVGVNSGDMVVGNMGSEMRFDYTVMGDMVNLGSRLEGTNKEYGSNIIISEFTHAAVKDFFCCRELDWVRVKGKKLPVKIFELLSEKKDEEKWRGFISQFAEGLALYRAAQWDEAVAAFRKVLAIKPDDYASTMYIQRCEDLKKNPPPQPWDGVFTMTKK